MERIEVLIDKLVAQKRNGSNAAQMLMTVQLLQNELMNLQQSNAPAGSKKVSVIMPANTAVTVNVADTLVEEKPKAEPAIQLLKPEEIKPVEIIKVEAKPVDVKPIEVKREEPKPVEIKKEEEKKELPEQPVIQAPEPVVQEVKVEEQRSTNEPYFLRRPVMEDFTKEEIKEPKPPAQPAPHIPFDAMAETPTLLQQRQHKEVHEAISERKESLNDRLKQEKKEVVHQLKDTPVKDLRKAIGINDKFLFVNELFRGDEGMYERSIKTINNFHILPEAEYWMNRELKVKLGWNDSKETVQHFYSLVRRRFS
ncbi:MAG TPA: hypothetical protein VM888_14785 [Chitinophagaceae bacterium]|nr:hypothetical protein [Chitinophagaceae bacterium]